LNFIFNQASISCCDKLSKLYFLLTLINKPSHLIKDQNVLFLLNSFAFINYWCISKCFSSINSFARLRSTSGFPFW
jgi:hypothetical protein